MSMRTPLSRVRGLGSAREGTGHFWVQRLTGLALAFLVVAFIVLVIVMVGRPYPEVAAILGNPFIALLMILMVGTGCWHMKLGMQVVIEDYFHGTNRLIAQIVNVFFSYSVAVASALALLKLSFGG